MRASSTATPPPRSRRAAAAWRRGSALGELDDFHGAGARRLADLRVVLHEIRAGPHRGALVGHVEDLGAGVLAEVAADAAGLDPHLLDDHDRDSRGGRDSTVPAARRKAPRTGRGAGGPNTRE